jgi:hypothetical protein
VQSKYWHAKATGKLYGMPRSLGKTQHCLWPKTLTHLNPLTYVLDAIGTFVLAGRTSATRVSGLSLRGLNLICRNAAQISNKS